MSSTNITITVPKKERSDNSRSTITPSFKRGLTCQGTRMEAVSVKDLAKEIFGLNLNSMVVPKKIIDERCLCITCKTCGDTKRIMFPSKEVASLNTDLTCTLNCACGKTTVSKLVKK